MSPEVYSKLKCMQLKKASESVDDDDTISYALKQSVASLQKVKIFCLFCDDDSKSLCGFFFMLTI